MNTFAESFTTAFELVLSFDPTLLAIVGRSLWVSANACLLACTIGLLVGAWLGGCRAGLIPFVLFSTPTTWPQVQDSLQLILDTQPKSGGGGGGLAREEVVDGVCEELLGKVGVREGGRKKKRAGGDRKE